MWFTCNVCNGNGYVSTNIDNILCSNCSRYNVYHNGILIFYGLIWCDDNAYEPVTSPSSP